MKKRIFAMLCIATMTISMLTACGTPNSNVAIDESVVDEPIANEPIANEPIADELVVDEPIANIVEYVSKEMSAWPKHDGMTFGYVREDGNVDFLVFKAVIDVDNGDANINTCFDGVSFSSTLDATNMKIANKNGVIGVTDNMYDLVVWYAPTEAEAIAVDIDVFGDGRYQSIGSGNFVIAFTSNITEEEAQAVLDSCVYYDNGDATLTQLETMDALVVEE